MKTGALKLPLLVTGLFMGTAGVSHADSDLFSAQTFKGWVDLRLSSADGEESWLKGDFGKLRFGGNEDGDRQTRLNLGQAALLWTPRFSDNITGYVLAQDVPDAQNQVSIEEAYVKWKPVPTSDMRFSFRLGQMFPPVSMEHDGPGWTVSRTITPSAINSWIGEEVIVDGLEANVQKTLGDHEVGATLAVFTRDDTAGTELAWRGWAQDDISSGDSTLLPLPYGNQGYAALFGPYQALSSRPLDEVDGRLGYYVRLDWRPPVMAAFNLEVYNNQGNPNAVRNGQWAWATRFYNLGAQFQLDAKDQVLAQYMAGHTATGGIYAGKYDYVDVNFDSAYILLTHSLDDGAKLSARIDYFGVKDNSLRDVDDNTDKGYSATVAWVKPLNAHLDLAIEALHVTSDHPARAVQGDAPRQTQTLVQAALKLHL